MTVIGITGGVGAGKSRILEILQKEYGAYVLFADKVAAELEEPGQEGYRLLVEAFGTVILGADHRLDRQAFAQMIFQDSRLLSEVNAMIHPLTWKAVREKLKAYEEKENAVSRVQTEAGYSCQEGAAGKGRPFLAAVEAALFDEQSREICHTLWYIDASKENRIRRLMEGRGYTLEKCLDIIKNQRSREEYLALADQVIDNNGTLEEVRRQIARLLGPCSDFHGQIGKQSGPAAFRRKEGSIENSKKERQDP